MNVSDAGVPVGLAAYEERSIPAEEQNAGRIVDYFYRMEFHITPRFFSDSNYLFVFFLNEARITLIVPFVKRQPFDLRGGAFRAPYPPQKGVYIFFFYTNCCQNKKDRTITKNSHKNKKRHFKQKSPAI